MIDLSEEIHLMQSEKWAKFKRGYGDTIFKVDGIYIFLKKLPFIKIWMGYSPKVNFNIQRVDFDNILRVCEKYNISFVRFEAPNVDLNSELGKSWNIKLKTCCKNAGRSSISTKTIIVDLCKSLDDLFNNMHPKRRYNIKYAQRHNVKINVSKDKKLIDKFYSLHKVTAEKQKFFTYPKEYFEKLLVTFSEDFFFISAEVENSIAVMWLLIHEGNFIYYVAGASDYRFRNLYPSDLVGFEAIKLGKNLKVKFFDLWGADPNKGFSDFKAKYGGQIVEYLPTYDFVIKTFPYTIFCFLQEGFWGFQYFIRGLLKL